MSAERLIASHLRLSAESLSAADVLLRAGNRNAAYQAEQAVEQLILALAQAESTPFTRSQQHQLETMRRALPEADAFRADLAELTWLESFATTYRYPRPAGGISDPPSVDRLQSAIGSMERLLRRVAAHFGVDLDLRSESPASQIEPPRGR